MPGMPRSICFHKKAPFVRFRNPVFHTNRDSGSLSYFHFTIYIQCFLNILSAIYQQSSRFSGTNPRFSRDLEQGYAEIMHRWLTKNTRSNTPRLTIGWRLISVFQKKTRKKVEPEKHHLGKNRNHLQLHFRVSNKKSGVIPLVSSHQTWTPSPFESRHTFGQ